VKTNQAAQRYSEALLAPPAFREWENEAEQETWAMPQTDSI
jgi:hypothetical protein